MVTLKMIADKCGYSTATVSKALNDMPDINMDTAQRIRDVAESMGYMPNAAARTLKTSRSKIIGLFMFFTSGTIWTHEYFSRIATSIQSVLENAGYDIVPIHSNRENDIGSYREYCRYRGYDGIIVMSAGFDDAQLVDLVTSNIPLVTVDYAFNNRSAVLSDNEQGMNDLVRYICSQGHRRIAFIHGEDSTVTRVRIASFYKAIEELGIMESEVYVREGFYNAPECSAKITEELLNLPLPPTCIIYPDDFSYIGGMNQIRKQGLKIPADISVAGYDGILLSEVLQPNLTTIKQDTEGMGYYAATMLLEAIEKPRTYISRHITRPSRLLTGGSIADIRGK